MKNILAGPLRFQRHVIRNTTRGITKHPLSDSVHTVRVRTYVHIITCTCMQLRVADLRGAWGTFISCRADFRANRCPGRAPAIWEGLDFGHKFGRKTWVSGLCFPAVSLQGAHSNPGPCVPDPRLPRRGPGPAPR